MRLLCPAERRLAHHPLSLLWCGLQLGENVPVVGSPRLFGDFLERRQL